jgi:hypothetical protein
MMRDKLFTTGLAVFVAVAVLIGSRWLPQSDPSKPIDPPAPPVPENVIVAPVGEMTRFALSAPADQVVWLSPESQAERLQVLEYADHVVLCPRVPGPFDFGSVTRYGSKLDPVKWWRVETGKAPQPQPGPGPLPPAPPTPSVDTALVTQFKAAIAKDVAAGAKREDAAKLAQVFIDGARHAANTKQFGELYSWMFEKSVAAGIPRRPYLNAVRTVIDDASPPRLDSEAVTAATSDDYARIGNALAEAGK